MGSTLQDWTDRGLALPADTALAPAAVWRLHVVASPDPQWRGSILTMTAGGVLDDGTQIGRVPDAPSSLQIDDSTLSRRHATFAKSGDHLLRVADLGSSNGTFWRGQRIQEALVGHLAVLRLGANVFVVERDAGTHAAHEEPSAEVPGRSEAARQLRAALAAGGEFRQPPLSERRLDLFALADALVPLPDVDGHRVPWPTVLHEETVEALLLYDWPNNVPELITTLQSLRPHVGKGPIPRTVLAPAILRHATLPPASQETARLKTGPRGIVSLASEDPSSRR